MFGSKIIQPKQANYIQGGGGGGQGPMGGMMKQMVGMGLKSALSGSPMAPMAGVLGSLFNEGGKVPKKKKSSWWDTVWGSQTGRNPNSLWKQMGRNMGGPISAHPNPHGYNEGGSVGETPIKKVMDEQKLEQQAMAFTLDQKRKQETHEQSMRIKEQQAKQAAAMKKASATTSKQPAKPKGPLSK